MLGELPVHIFIDLSGCCVELFCDYFVEVSLKGIGSGC
jgi:hypothetical protein